MVDFDLIKKIIRWGLSVVLDRSRKYLDLKSLQFNIPLYRTPFQAKHFWVSNPKFPKKVVSALILRKPLPNIESTALNSLF